MCMQKKRTKLTNGQAHQMEASYWASLLNKALNLAEPLSIGYEDTPYAWGEHVGHATLTDMDKRVIDFLDNTYPTVYGSGDWNTPITIGREFVIDYLCEQLEDGYINPLVARRLLKYPELLRKIARSAIVAPSYYRCDGIDVNNRRHRFMDRVKNSPSYFGKELESTWLLNHPNARRDPACLALFLHMCECGALSNTFSPLIREKVLAENPDLSEDNWTKEFLSGYTWHDHRIHSDKGYTRDNVICIPNEVHIYVHKVANKCNLRDTRSILEDLGWLKARF